jgi:hypothetical protein
MNNRDKIDEPTRNDALLHACEKQARAQGLTREETLELMLLAKAQEASDLRKLYEQYSRNHAFPALRVD